MSERPLPVLDVQYIERFLTSVEKPSQRSSQHAPSVSLWGGEPLLLTPAS